MNETEMLNLAQESQYYVAKMRHALHEIPELGWQEGYGKNYHYDHDMPEAFSGPNYFPEGIPRPSLYTPPERGFEREMKKRLHFFQNLRLKKNT